MRTIQRQGEAQINRETGSQRQRNRQRDTERGRFRREAQRSERDSNRCRQTQRLNRGDTERNMLIPVCYRCMQYARPIDGKRPQQEVGKMHKETDRRKNLRVKEQIRKKVII